MPGSRPTSFELSRRQFLGGGAAVLALGASRLVPFAGAASSFSVVKTRADSHLCRNHTVIGMRGYGVGKRNACRTPERPSSLVA